MKYSQFNTVLPYDDKFVLYNTFSNNLMVLDPVIKDLLDAARNEGLENLVDVHPTFLEALQKSEFVLDDTVNEIDKVKEIRNVVDFNETNYHLTINPTMNCNFKCWYCYETHVKDSRMNEEIIERVNKFLTTQIIDENKIKSFTLSWFGGEPLLYFYDIVLPIMKHFNEVVAEKGIHGEINFTSNGFLINPKMVELFKKHKVASLQITLDGYEDDHNKVRYVSATRGSYRQIVENVALLVKNGIFIRLRVNFTLDNIQNCYKIIDDISHISEEDRKLLMLDFHRVWQDSDPADDGMLQDQFEMFREAGFRVASNLSMDNVRNSCYADKKNSAVINYNGDVFKCTARDFTNFKRDGIIDETGSIVWENGSLENRMDIKFKNKPCLSCRLLPVCNGGCSQHAVEHVAKNEEYCVFDFDEKRKTEVVRAKVNELLELM